LLFHHLYGARYLARRFDVDRLAAFVFMLSSPVGYFAFAPYSDVLLLGLLTALILLARSRMPWNVGAGIGGQRSQSWLSSCGSD
jgi:hypothetical protein